MAESKIVKRSNILLAGKERDIKLVSKANPGKRGKQYDVMVDNRPKYSNVQQRSDAVQLYRQTRDEAKEELKSGNSGGGGMGLNIGLGGGFGGGGPTIPGFGMQDEDDEDDGFNFPGF